MYNYCKSVFILILYRNPFLSLIITGNCFIASFTKDVASKFAIVAIKVISNIQKYNREFLDTLSSTSIPHSKCAFFFNYYCQQQFQKFRVTAILIFFIKKCYVSEVKFCYYSAYDGCSLRGSTEKHSAENSL
jgi:hypothetical protein